MVETPGQEVPQTLEGWYLLHDVYSVNWTRWKAEDTGTRQEIASQAAQWLDEAVACEKGDSAAYNILTQKGDLMFLHYRATADELNRVELSLHQTRLYDFLTPAAPFLWPYAECRFSVTEESEIVSLTWHANTIATCLGH